MSREPTKMPETKLRRVRTPLTVVTLAAVSGIVLAGCVSTHPVNKPCGVIVDPLGDVQSTTPEGNKRIDAHFERGVQAGCWTRATAKPIESITPDG